MLQLDTVSIETGDAGDASLGAPKGEGVSATLNSVLGISRCSVETNSGAGGASGITAEREGSGAIKDGEETDSSSRAGSADSGRGGTGCSTWKALGGSFERVDGVSGREGSSEKRTGVACERSDSPTASDSTIDPLAALKIEG